MFNLFKKKSELKLDSLEAAFIEAVVNKLSVKYPLFKREIELEAFVGVGKNPGGSKGSFTYLINNEIWKKLCDPSIDNYDVKNIIFKSYTGGMVNVDLFVSEGLIIGYKSNVQVKEIDIATIDVSKIWEKHFLNDDFNKINHLIDSLTVEELTKLNMVKNTFQIDIEGSSYYPIHDIEDGNYIAIDTSGAVFKITHDPFQVLKMFHNIPEYLNSL